MIRIITLVLMLPLFLFAKIESISTPEKLISTLTEAVTPETLIVFDIDNTLLIHPEKSLRSTALHLFLQKLKKQTHLPHDQAIMLIEQALNRASLSLEDGNLLSSHTKIFVDLHPSTKIIALSKADAGMKRISIPSMGIDYTHEISNENRILTNLNVAGINLSDSFPNINISTDTAIYKQGVLLSGKHSKSQALLQLLKKSVWKPKKIIYIDDCYTDVFSTYQMVQKQNIDFVGIHFTYVAKHLCNIEKNIQEQQLDAVINCQKWLSEQECIGREQGYLSPLSQ